MCLAVPGRVVELSERDDVPMADVDFGGVRKEVCLQYVPDASVGDYLIVHVGFAIERLDEASALESLRLFESLGLLEEEFGDGVSVAARAADGKDHAPIRLPSDQQPASHLQPAQAADHSPSR